jgi:hypothetical protein
MSPPAAANSRRKYTVGVAWRAASTTRCGARVKKNVIGRNQKRIDAPLDQSRKRRIDVANGPGIQDNDVLPNVRAVRCPSTDLLTSSRTGSSKRTYQGDRRHLGALRVTLYPCTAASRRVAGEFREAGLPAVPRYRPAEQGADAQGQGKARLVGAQVNGNSNI